MVWCILIIACVYPRPYLTLNARAIRVGGTVWCYLFNSALGKTRALINMYLIISSLLWMDPIGVVQRQALSNMYSIIIIIMYLCSIAKKFFWNKFLSKRAIHK